MPLALTQAAAYIPQRAPRCSSSESALGLLDGEARDHRHDREATGSIARTWQIFFEHVQQVRPSAADLLGLMSFFKRQVIHASLIRHRGGGTYTRPAVQQGKDSHVQADPTGKHHAGAMEDGFEEDVSDGSQTQRNFWVASSIRYSERLRLRWDETPSVLVKLVGRSLAMRGSPLSPRCRQ
ncbi:hypothetical protein LTR91_022555 [Friedmanniomyces endolithicus]|uniref:Uncharacterized protein n=1 Tax=Friedmanniomyces endolithicus TaxID=329885 RepID=A0AAN6JZ83_9PEZI|nr:hypothetical protein LTR38_016286 [Friedmanniomyces endolithicus]KAK0956073.1 hypothetical protein LTR91_022555 [Friedmanniomyces endolithicus]